jgi:hypothetical protein
MKTRKIWIKNLSITLVLAVLSMKDRLRLAAGSLLFLSVILLPVPGAAAQTAAELERVLALPEVSYGDAAWVVLNAAGTAIPETTEDSAASFRFVADNGWLPKKAEAEGKVRLDGLSLLLMRSFDIPGGLMYRLFHNARYAYREMKALGFIRGRAYSSSTVSGAEFLQLLGELLAYTGDAAALSDEGSGHE